MMRLTRFTCSMLALCLMCSLPAFAADLVEDWVDLGLIHASTPSERNYYPSVLYRADGFPDPSPGEPYMMWYTGKFAGVTTLGVATSTDGLSWSPGVSLELPSSHHCAVVFIPEGFAATGPEEPGTTMHYRLYFWDMAYLYEIEAIAYAESPDGLTWYNRKPISQVGDTVVPANPGSWRGSYGPAQVFYNADGHAVRDPDDPMGNRFVMYYDLTSGGAESLGLAFSDDGLHWEGYAGNPVLQGTQNWETCGEPPTPNCWEYLSRSHAIEYGGGWAIFYSAGHGSMDDGIGLATSPDGINWTKDELNPIIHIDPLLNRIPTDPPGDCYRNNRAYCPSIVDDGSSQWKMYYTAKSSDCPDGSNYAMGLMVIDLAFEVAIDVRPNNTANQINTNANQQVPIAVLGSESFDPVTELDIESVTAHGATPSATKFTDEDVNLDGFMDRVLYFRATNFDKPSEEECIGPATLLLQATTTLDEAFYGSDYVDWLGPDCNF